MQLRRLKGRQTVRKDARWELILRLASKRASGSWMRGVNERGGEKIGKRMRW